MDQPAVACPPEELCKQIRPPSEEAPPVEQQRRPSSQPSNSQTNGDMCRICHCCEADAENPLISPCYCAGSLRYVHQACLLQWIRSSDTRCCELCKFAFIMRTKTKPFREWENLVMSPEEQRRVLLSITFHVVAITRVVWSLFGLMNQMAGETCEGNLDWLFCTKRIVVAIGITGGLALTYVQCKMYVQLFRRWKSFNRVVYIQDAPVQDRITAHLSPPVAVQDDTSSKRPPAANVHDDPTETTVAKDSSPDTSGADDVAT